MNGPALHDRPCPRCPDGVIPAGTYRMICDRCKRIAVDKRAAYLAQRVDEERRVCRTCGAEKPPGRGLVYCKDCQPLAKWRRTRRDVLRMTVLKRKPCRGCGGAKPPGCGRIYCDACRRTKTCRPEVRTCIRCAAQPVRPGRYMKLCTDCAAGALERKRERHRTYVRRMRNDPTWWKRHLEVARESHRRSRQRIREQARELPASVTLPAGQLGAAIERLATVEERNPFAVLEPTRSNLRLDAVCGRLGVGARVVFGWRIGERPTVHLYKALDVLDRAGLMWWDVWNEDTVRTPILEVRGYEFRSKRGGRCCRVRAATTLLGDWGPDLETLERIRHFIEDTITPDELVALRKTGPYQVAAARKQLEAARAAELDAAEAAA